MAHSRRFRRGLRLACIAALGLALAGEGWTSAPSALTPGPRIDGARVSMMVEQDVCKPGPVEAILDRWLDATDRWDFESEFAAAAFDKLVQWVNTVRDMAQDFCV